MKNAQDYKAAPKLLLFDVMDSIVKSAIFSRLDSIHDPDPGEKPNTPAPAEPQTKKRKVDPGAEGDFEAGGGNMVDPKPVIPTSVCLGFSGACCDLQDTARETTSFQRQHVYHI